MAIKLKLLAVATLAWMAPVAAHRAPLAGDHHRSSCASERSTAETIDATAAIVVVEGSPGAASVLGLARASAFMP
jgi:hypothetical protein